MTTKASSVRPKKEWPTDGSPANLADDILLPIRKAFEQAYTLQRINNGKAIRWNGLPSTIEGMSFDEALSVRGIRDTEDLDGDALDILIAIAAQVGIEQGRRLERANIKPTVKLFEKGLETVEEKVGTFAAAAKTNLKRAYTELMSKGKK